MRPEPQPGSVLSVLEHDGLRFEVANTQQDEAVFVSCLDAQGVVRWRRLLPAPDLVVLFGNLHLEAGSLIVDAGGEHCRGGTEYGWTFTLTLSGELLKKQEVKP